MAPARQAAADARLELPATLAARAAVRRAEGRGSDGADWAFVSTMHAAAPPLPPPAAPAALTPAGAPPVFDTLDALEASVPPPIDDGRGERPAHGQPAHRPSRLTQCCRRPQSGRC